jgi:hypothetical protein
MEKPKWAFERLWRHTLPCISFNTLGWGYYRPNLLRWEDKQLLPLLRAIPLAFSFILMLIPMAQGLRPVFQRKAGLPV